MRLAAWTHSVRACRQHCAPVCVAATGQRSRTAGHIQATVGNELKAPIQDLMRLSSCTMATQPAMFAETSADREDFAFSLSRDGRRVGLPSQVYIGIDPDLNGAVSLLLCRPHAARAAGDEAPTMTSPQDVVTLWRSTAAAEASRVWDVPTEMYSLMSGKRKRRIDAVAVTELLRSIVSMPEVAAASRHNLLTVTLERPSPIPDLDGWQSAAVSAYGHGIFVGVLAALGIQPIQVLAVHWKRHMMLYKESKDESRALASQVAPELEDSFKQKRSHGRAEATLIAAWSVLFLTAHQEDTKRRLQVVESQLDRKAARLEEQRLAIKEQKRMLRALTAPGHAARVAGSAHKHVPLAGDNVEAVEVEEVEDVI